MVENFGGSVLYLILFLIQLLGLSFYSYLVMFNPKKIITDYEVGEGAIAPIRLIGSGRGLNLDQLHPVSRCD